MGGKGGSADPSGMYAAMASEQAAQLEYQLGSQQLQWAQSVWNQEQPLVTQSEQLQIQAAQQQMQFEQQQEALYNQYYAPLEKAYIAQVGNWASPANIAQVTGEATSGVASNVQQGLNTAKEQLESYGVNPSDPRYAGLYIGANAMGAAAEAGAGTTAAQNLRLQQMEMEQGAISTGRGIASGTPSMTNAAAGAGSGAASTGQQNLATGSTAMTAPVNWFNSGATNMGVYTNAVNAYNTAQLGYAQLGAQEMSGFGSILGDITGMFKFEKGGVVKSPVIKFATAGTVTPLQEQTALSSALYGPNAPYSQAQIMAGSPTMTVGQMQAADIAAMTPDQQAWYNAQTAALTGYQNATGAAGASYTAPTGGFGGQAPTVNQGQLALANNQQAMYQGQFNPTEPTTPAPAPAASPVPAPYVAPASTITKTVAPIGGSVVQMNPFAPPVTTPATSQSAPAGSGSNLQPTNPNATGSYNPNSANTAANPSSTGWGNRPQNNQTASQLATTLAGYVDQSNPRRNVWGTGAQAGFARGGGVNSPAGQSPIPIPAGSTPGGPIPPHASPSMGAATDDVPSMLTAGEFVIPKDVAQWKGHEHFVKAIDKARIEQHQMKNRGDIGGEPARAPPQRPTFVSRPSPIPLRRFG